ncbi:hypothetical protein LY28_01212 [Ruminiclostridium sufflavum DSM 19573]|uniref:Phosphoesterase n=1 Tax=Ruminiclostridium sufflavum DSM 19573 TaxID=1121337 RepID=A0A318XMU2_9FIRM|nr:metallophosphoesterase [Ruminiclostridium sufflavum]PYG88851.1 hypothetical protein LY28_01212 [Ruminiclostridium sufflavum DSM 19573]
MKVLVISDTHGYISNARYAIDKNPEAEMVIHLGDYCKDAVQLSKLYPGIIFEFVSGNCDNRSNAVCTEKTIEIENCRIFMTHGHNYSVKLNLRPILKRAEEENARLVLFGHTHIAGIDKEDNILLINPGSISQSRGSKPESYAVLDISEGKIKADIFYV